MEARLRAGLTQSAVARQVGISASQLSKLEGDPERSDMRFSTVAQIAAVLGISLDTVAVECDYFKGKVQKADGFGPQVVHVLEALESADRLTEKARAQIDKALGIVQKEHRRARRR